MGRFVAILFAAMVLVSCAGSAAVIDPQSLPATAEVTPAANAGRTTTCRADQTYRAAFAESDPATNDRLVEIFQEVTASHQFVEASNGTRLLVIDDTAWTTEDGVWEQFPTVPVRPLRIPWVDNFITGSEIVDAFSVIEQAETEGIAANVYRPTLEQMADTFKDRFRDSEYDPAGSTFEYWVDDCDDVVLADVTLTFAGEDAVVASDAGIPATLRYTFDLYDVGAEIAPVDPSSPPATIKRPVG